MPISYKLTKINDNITGNQTPRYSVTTVSKGNINLEGISKRISSMSTVTSGDVDAVIINLIDVMSQCIQEGNTVTIDGLGTFSPTASLKKEVTNPAKVRAEVIQLKSIAFRPSPSFKKKVNKAGFTRIRE